MLSRSQPIPDSSLRRLHPDAVDDPARILDVLHSARAEGTIFHRGLDSQIDLERATLERVEADRLVLRTLNFEASSANQIFLNFDLGGRPYFFATRPLARPSDGELEVEMPSALYWAERRDRVRLPPTGPDDARRVALDLSGGRNLVGEIADASPGGMGLLVDETLPIKEKGVIRVRYLDGRRAGEEARLYVRSQEPSRTRSGWSRLGLVRADWGGNQRLRVERRREILPPRPRVPLAPGWQSLGRDVETSFAPRVVRYRNRDDEEIVGILDSWGETRGAPAILIPTGWGQTKESLLPLARTIVACFRAWDQPVSVLRFDGIRQRGESHNDPECRLPGREYHNFTFSQGVRDIEASLDFLEQTQEFAPSSSILVTFSIATIAGRRAVADDDGRRIAGWLSVVGSPDMQSAIRSISGGVDLAAGYEQGMRFGMQELLGVTVDTDRIGVDANENQMVFLEHSRRDFSRIGVPLTWFHGEFDAWMDLDRVQDVLSHGDQSRRRLVTIPTGHQVRSSRQAIETFRSITSEIGRMLWNEERATVPPDPVDVRRRWLAEGRRRRAPKIDLRAFWNDYLLGRDGSLGIELLTHARHYKAMMSDQIEALGLCPGDRVADLGSGTGSLPLALARSADRPKNLRIREFDYIHAALQRARRRIETIPGHADMEVAYTACDLNLLNAEHRIPALDRSFDAVLASLLLSYVDYPLLLLRDVRRILRPGGRLVVSSLCRDADFSRLYVDGFAEVQIAGTLEALPESEGRDLPSLARNFLNDAARILQLEESGAFQMWDPDELEDLVARAGFRNIRVRRSLGDPPQGVVLSAVRD